MPSAAENYSPFTKLLLRTSLGSIEWDRNGTSSRDAYHEVGNVIPTKSQGGIGAPYVINNGKFWIQTKQVDRTQKLNQCPRPHVMCLFWIGIPSLASLYGLCGKWDWGEVFPTTRDRKRERNMSLILGWITLKYWCRLKTDSWETTSPLRWAGYPWQTLGKRNWPFGQSFMEYFE